MYLNDKDIRENIPNMNIETNDPNRAFKQDEQVQPCSIDLRLSEVFWVPKKNFIKNVPIDLRKSSLSKMVSDYCWERKTLSEDACITLKPREMVLGRTYEKFTIPSDLAGAIEGRSSFARLGLMIHCTGDFINPGYRGQMTLQLVNLSPFTIKIFPYIPICQLKLVKLTGVPESIYGAGNLDSKYKDDDGGPSKWWRDRGMKELHTKLKSVSVSQTTQANLEKTADSLEPETIVLLTRFCENAKPAQLENAEVILNEFAMSEDKRRKKTNLLRWIPAVPLALTGGFGFKLFFEPIHWYSIPVWCAVALSVLAVGFVVLNPLGEFLGTAELKKLRASKK